MAYEIISQDNAKAKGLKRYFSGLPCENGHLAERYASCHQCVECAKIYRKRKNPNWRPVSESPRNRALRAGEKLYFSGKPCKNGHICGRDTKHQYCVECRKLEKFRHYPRLNEWKKEYFKKNSERLAAKRKKWNEENKERKKYLYRRRYAAKKDEILAQSKEWLAKQPKGYRAEIARIDRRKNPEKYRARVRNRRARLRYNGGKHSGQEIVDILKLQRNRCASCREKLKGKYQVDHIIPLAKGGKNDRANLQVLCAKCNRAKSDKDPLIFAREMGFLI